MFLLQLQLYVLTIIRVTLRRIQKPLGESPHFVSLNIPFLAKKVIYSGAPPAREARVWTELHS